MHVRIIEARKNQLAVGIDDACIRAAKFFDFAIRIHGDDAVANNRQCLCCRSCGIHRVDVRVDDYQVSS